MQIKTAGTATVTEGGFTGYAATWVREPDSYGDVVAKGAFSRTLKEWEAKGRPIPVLWGHRTDEPKYYIGTVETAEEDDHGLKVNCSLDGESATAQHVRRLLKAGAVAQMSFAFDIKESADVELPGGRKARELRDITLYEVSVVPIGANQDTSIDDVKAPNNTRDGDGDDEDADALTEEEVATVRAILSALKSALEEREADDNTGKPAEAADSGGKASPVEAAARLNMEMTALIREGERSMR